MSQLKFQTPDGKTLERHGNSPISEMIAQATNEFGQITVVNEVDEPIEVDPSIGNKNILETARFNLQTSYDQLASLNEDYPLHDAKAHIASTIALIDQELETLG